MGKLIFTPDLCTGCRACELACSFISEGIFAPAKSRIRVVRMDEDGIDVPIGCLHCEDAPCIMVCPAKAIKRHTETQAVVIDQDICIGCKECIVVCPFGAIQYDETKRLIYKCDLCQGEPECVKWCYTGAIQYTKDVSRVTHKKQRKAALKIARAAEGARKIY
ncbi:4Fe-4S dicluster domain-containing protein [Planctomycetota bacterium]